MPVRKVANHLQRDVTLLVLSLLIIATIAEYAAKLDEISRVSEEPEVIVPTCIMGLDGHTACELHR